MTQWLVRRGLLATVPVASLALVFACSSEPVQTPTESGAPEPNVTPDARAGVELAPTPRGTARFEQLLSRFGRVPAELKEPPLKVPAGILPPKHVPAPSSKPVPTPVLRSGDAKRFSLRGDRVRAEVDPLRKTEVLISASVDLPTMADGFVRVQPDNSDVGVEFKIKGANAKAGLEVVDGNALYPAGAAGGGDVILRVTPDAVEDYIVLTSKPTEPYVEYTVNVSQMGGLRLFSNTLEFLTAKGEPQLRIQPPRLYDGDATRHEATLEVHGCAVDRSNLPPWGRAVTPPGAGECTVRVTWDDRNVIYPVIVDPVWSTAGSLNGERSRNAAVKLANGHVLTCGGSDSDSLPTATCETFNPALGGGAGVWTTVNPMTVARYDFTLLLHPPSGHVIAVGGAGSTSSERYNGSAWVASNGDFSGGYFSPPPFPVITSDNYIVLLDVYGRPFVLPLGMTGPDTWVGGTQNPIASPYRYDFAVQAIPTQGTVARIGGDYGSTYFATVERYRPGADTVFGGGSNGWSNPGDAGTMKSPRYNPASFVLDANRVLVYGGNTGLGASSKAEIYTVSSDSWAYTNGDLPNNGQAYQSYTGRGLTAALHGSGKMLSNTDSQQYIFDPSAASNAWTAISTYNAGFYSFGSQANVVNVGTRVLMVPVQPTGSSGNTSAACRLFDLGDKGSICSATVECKTNLTCVIDTYDGVGTCCDSACGNACNSCRAVNKTSNAADGTCGPRKINQYVGSTACPSSASTTCGNSGNYCDGAGSCLKWTSDYSCGQVQSCLDGNTQANAQFCDGQGGCPGPTTTDCGTGYACLSDYCYASCYSDVYCDTNYFCNTNVSWPGTCDAKKSDGAACNYNNAECVNGHCVDGVCCDETCDGPCEACTNALTGQTNGACNPIAAGSDPQGECYDQQSYSCAQNGSCDGSGACQLYANGTQCADIDACASETARFIPDTCNGTGTCDDKGSANCSPGYSCQNGVCNTQCTSDANCASNYWCDTANQVCIADRTQGQSCAREAVCSGNANCVDGVCCDSGCAGSCRSCVRSRTGLATDGICGNIVDDTDPENECATGAAYPNSCAAPGLCNGAGACRPYAKTGIECDTDVCVDSTLTTYSCNGAGTCKAQSEQCYPFKCDTTNNVCRVACSLDAHCVDGSACENGTCVGQLENGAPCTRGPQCSTGFCANIAEGVLQGDETGAGGDGAGGAAGDPGTDSPGVCCDEQCQGTCSGCKASIKGFGSDGICEFVKNNTDPASDCDPAADDRCGLDGQCNGGGACRLAPTGTSCGDTTCQGNSVLGQSCNGQGDCINNQGGVDCAPYVCRDVLGAFQCTQPCADDNDCQDGYFCEEATCKKKLANGKLCATSGVCDSGYCVDGLCCDASCNGQCEACDSPGSEGVCSPVQGEPHGSRAKCDHAGEECGGACDGVNAAACKYAATGTDCGEASCNNGLANSSVCNGQGECRANAEAECSPYVCGEDETCLTRCEIDADCSQGYGCDETTQRCLPATVAAECSEDRQSSVGQNGISTPCKPFLCVPASGTCAVSCAFTTDCAPEFVCEASTKTCLPAPPDAGTGDEEGCACRAAGASTSRSSYGLALFALGLGLTGLRRRKRSPHLSEQADVDR